MKGYVRPPKEGGTEGGYSRITRGRRSSTVVGWYEEGVGSPTHWCHNGGTQIQRWVRGGVEGVEDLRRGELAMLRTERDERKFRTMSYRGGGER
eukprot:752843-Hanusia_phi.AAC.2